MRPIVSVMAVCVSLLVSTPASAQQTERTAQITAGFQVPLTFIRVGADYLKSSSTLIPAVSVTFGTRILLGREHLSGFVVDGQYQDVRDDYDVQDFAGRAYGRTIRYHPVISFEQMGALRLTTSGFVLLGGVVEVYRSHQNTTRDNLDPNHRILVTEPLTEGWIRGFAFGVNAPVVSQPISVDVTGRVYILNRDQAAPGLSLIVAPGIVVRF